MTSNEQGSEAPLRVLHVLRDDHTTHIGGDLVQLRETVAALRSEGIEAIAATMKDAPEDLDVVQVYNVQLAGELNAAVRTARRRWPDAAVVVSPIFPQTSFAAFRSRQALTMRKAARALVGDIVRSVRARSIMASVDAVLANSAGELAHVRRWFRVHLGEVAFNGITIETWPQRTAPLDRQSSAQRLGLDPNTSTLVACVGRLEPLKNQLTLMRAVDRVPGAAVVLVGPDGHPSYSAMVRAAAARRPGKVALTGPLTQPEVAALLAEVDVHVLPSFRESFGLVNLEAAACGCEVVAARASWTREWLGDAAAYADAASPDSIAAAILEVRARPRQPHLRTVVEGFGWSATAQATAECYRRVRSARRPGAAR